MSKEEGNLTKDKSRFAVCGKYRGSSSSQDLSKCILIPEAKRDSDLRGVLYLQCERQGAEACHFSLNFTIINPISSRDFCVIFSYKPVIGEL
jgi:hypothetical protein